jgi:predicted PurR-regulated permease PerM
MRGDLPGDPTSQPTCPARPGGDMENANVRERLFFYLAFLVLIILTVLMFRPFFTVLIISLISVIMLKPVNSFFVELQ